MRAPRLARRPKPVLGERAWDGTRWRRWSGRRWASAVYSLNAQRLKVATPLELDPRLDDARRAHALASAGEHQVSTNTATVLFEGPHGTVLAYRRRVSHGFHAVMTLFTGGLWAVVWLAVFLGRGEDRIRLEVDAWGNVWASRVTGA